MYSYGPPHMAKQKQDDQLEHTFSSHERIRDVALKTDQRRWTTGRSGERASGVSVLAARHDDYDDDNYIWPIDRTLSGTATPDQSEQGSNSNEDVLHNLKRPKTEASISDCLMSWPGHSLESCYPSAEMQSVYFAAHTNWAISSYWPKFYITTEESPQNISVETLQKQEKPISEVHWLTPKL